MYSKTFPFYVLVQHNPHFLILHVLGFFVFIKTYTLTILQQLVCIYYILKMYIVIDRTLVYSY